MTDSLASLRADFEARSRRSLSLPIAGMVVWAAAGAFGWNLTDRSAALLLVAPPARFSRSRCWSHASAANRCCRTSIRWAG